MLLNSREVHAGLLNVGRLALGYRVICERSWPAFFGLFFTTIAGSIGAELSIGESVLTQVCNAFSIYFEQLTLQPIDV
jgi:hypothetical protein